MCNLKGTTFENLKKGHFLGVIRHRTKLYVIWEFSTFEKIEKQKCLGVVKLWFLQERVEKKGIRNPKKLPKYIEKTKIDEMLEKARNNNKRNYLILLTLWRTGIRNSELINLKKRDIKVDELTIRQGKGHKDRIVPLDNHLSDLLQYHTAKIPLDDEVFPLTSAQIRNITHRYQPKEEVVKPHTLRHSFAVHCLKQGMNLRSLQKILGHNDLATTAVYLDLIAKDIKEDYNKIEW